MLAGKNREVPQNIHEAQQALLGFHNKSGYSYFFDQSPVYSEVIIDEWNLANLNDYLQLAFIPDPCSRDSLLIHDVINASLLFRLCQAQMFYLFSYYNIFE